MKARSLSDLATLTGLKPRTLQFWAQSGVLRAEGDTLHRGPGVHRKYPQIEVEIACVLAAITPFSLQVGTLNAIASLIREAHEYGTSKKIASPADLLRRESYRRLKEDDPEKAKALYEADYRLNSTKRRPYLDDAQYKSLSVYVAMNEGRQGRESIMMLYFDRDEVIAVPFSEANFDAAPAFYDRVPAALVINLGVALPKAQT